MSRTELTMREVLLAEAFQTEIDELKSEIARLRKALMEIEGYEANHMTASLVLQQIAKQALEDRK